MNKAGRLLFLTLPCLLFSCASSSPASAKVGYAFGTAWEITLYDGTQEQANEIAQVLLRKSHLLDCFYIYKDGFNITSLNSERKGTLDPFLYRSLQEAVEMQKESEGYFSPFLGDVIGYWEENLEQDRLPQEGYLEELLEKAKGTSLVFKKNYEVELIGEGLIDLGGIGKGLVLDELKDMLDGWGVNHYLINGGTSSMLLGKKEGDLPFGLYLADDPSFHFKAQDTSLSCSSISRQSYEIEGKTYSHFVNPFDGSAEAIRTMVLALGEDASKADAYTTAAMNMDLEDAIEFLEAGDFEYAILEDGELTTSEGLK